MINELIGEILKQEDLEQLEFCFKEGLYPVVYPIIVYNRQEGKKYGKPNKLEK